jgi:predicted DNA-binding transcriptional regulator AlpA
MSHQELLGTKAVSEWTGVPEETLRYWRHRNEGPASFKLGPKRVVYAREDVQRWIDAQRSASLGGGRVD